MWTGGNGLGTQVISAKVDWNSLGSQGVSWIGVVLEVKERLVSEVDWYCLGSQVDWYCLGSQGMSWIGIVLEVKWIGIVLEVKECHGLV